MPSSVPRRWWASLSVRGERATIGLRRALSEASEGTVLARPEARLSGRARGVVLVADNEAKRQSGSPVRHLQMLSLNSTPRVRPVRSPGCIGRGTQRGCWSVPSWWRSGARCLAVVRVLAFSAPPARGLFWGFVSGRFRSRTAPPPRSVSFGVVPEPPYTVRRAEVRTFLAYLR